MIEIRIGDKYYNVATAWKDIDANKIINCKNVYDEIIVCSNIPKEILLQISEDNIFAIANLLTFLDSEEDIQAIALPLQIKSFAYHPRYEKYFSFLIHAENKLLKAVANIEIETYDKLETAKACLKEKKKLYQYLICLAKVYHPLETDIIYLLSYGSSLLIQLNAFIKHYKEMFEREPETDEINAGIEQLSIFGTYGTAFTLAQKDPSRVDAILNMMAIEIYTALFYSFKESEYIKNLYQVRKSNAEIEAKREQSRAPKKPLKSFTRKVQRGSKR